MLTEHIASWLQTWEGLFDSPYGVVVDDSTYNVLLATRSVLQEWVAGRPPGRTTFDPGRADSGFKGDLVRRLRTALQGLATPATVAWDLRPQPSPPPQPVQPPPNRLAPLPRSLTYCLSSAPPKSPGSGRPCVNTPPSMQMY